MPTAARWPCAAPSALSSSRLGLIIAKRDREQAGALVMVDDDHVEPGGAAPPRALRTPARRNRRMTRDARAARLQLDQRLARRAVALHQPVGDVDDRLGAEPAQQQHQQAPRWSRRRRHNRRRWRSSRPPGPRRRAASRPCPCPGSSDGSGRKSRMRGSRWRARSSRARRARAAARRPARPSAARARPAAASATAGRSPIVRC